MVRRLALALIALSLTLVPLWSPAALATPHAMMARVAAHGNSDHCDRTQSGAEQAAPAECAACPCAVGMVALPCVAIRAPAGFSANRPAGIAGLPPRPHDDAPAPPPPRL